MGRRSGRGPRTRTWRSVGEQKVGPPAVGVVLRRQDEGASGDGDLDEVQMAAVDDALCGLCRRHQRRRRGPPQRRPGARAGPAVPPPRSPSPGRDGSHPVRPSVHRRDRSSGRRRRGTGVVPVMAAIVVVVTVGVVTIGSARRGGRRRRGGACGARRVRIRAGGGAVVGDRWASPTIAAPSRLLRHRGWGGAAGDEDPPARPRPTRADRSCRADLRAGRP